MQMMAITIFVIILKVTSVQAQNMSQMGRTADTAKIEMHRVNPRCDNRAFDGPVSDALKRICADQDRERQEWIRDCMLDWDGDTKALEHCLKVAP
jgi:hypothetical protein